VAASPGHAEFYGESTPRQPWSAGSQATAAHQVIMAENRLQLFDDDDDLLRTKNIPISNDDKKPTRATTPI
jgi:hypothetical protein